MGMETTKQKLTDEQRKALIQKWASTPSPNPRYGGATPTDVARALLRPQGQGREPDTK